MQMTIEVDPWDLQENPIEVSIDVNSILLKYILKYRSLLVHGKLYTTSKQFSLEELNISFKSAGELWSQAANVGDICEVYLEAEDVLEIHFYNKESSDVFVVARAYIYQCLNCAGIYDADKGKVVSIKTSDAVIDLAKDVLGVAVATGDDDVFIDLSDYLFDLPSKIGKSSCIAAQQLRQLVEVAVRVYHADYLHLY